ncbi:hypothetical protein CONCODRAFT_14044 [Conidiobolus coronatus NRRL 28638]|uniref:Uncharacterized protein n=1 Tax=Conidiobolus coronatus (strain ATCC 28846 / CBS 209.66 / NRRL 28638) TaxID=796925 RepID=A0A137NPR8_CONC2|nr:hypothetical protein CONCODRAFT_14044 [Conidiobolus coronatus NRRL 28638]|eukprot:KXN64721.1 hypothetical protein CONCODRAFT_14044 [Conidiobolus coronatus NRRL 28638]
MNIIALAIFTYSTAAQITLVTSSNSYSNVSNTPGCYQIQPSISEVKGAEGHKLEFYNHFSCKGRKVGEFTGSGIFKSPIFAISIKVIKSLQNNQTNELGSEETIKDNNIDPLKHGNKIESLDKEKVNTNESENSSPSSINYENFDISKVSSKRVTNAEHLNKETSDLEYCEEGSEMNGEECISVNNDNFSTEYEDTDDWKNNGPDFEDKAFDISKRPIEYDNTFKSKIDYLLLNLF